MKSNCSLSPLFACFSVNFQWKGAKVGMDFWRSPPTNFLGGSVYLLWWAWIYKKPHIHIFCEVEIEDVLEFSDNQLLIASFMKFLVQIYHFCHCILTKNLEILIVTPFKKRPLPCLIPAPRHTHTHIHTHKLKQIYCFASTITVFLTALARIQFFTGANPG